MSCAVAVLASSCCSVVVVLVVDAVDCSFGMWSIVDVAREHTLPHQPISLVPNTVLSEWSASLPHIHMII